MLSAGDANETMGGATLPPGCAPLAAASPVGSQEGHGALGREKEAYKLLMLLVVDAAAKSFRSFLILLFEPHEHLTADISQREKTHKTISTNMVFQAAFFHGERQCSNPLKELLTIT